MCRGSRGDYEGEAEDWRLPQLPKARAIRKMGRRCRLLLGAVFCKQLACHFRARRVQQEQRQSSKLPQVKNARFKATDIHLLLCISY